MGRKTEVEWYNSVEVKEKFQYEEKSREEIDKANRMKEAYISWKTKEKEDFNVRQKTP
jgi:hypothetical protein